jgi:hypothetical protein
MSATALALASAPSVAKAPYLCPQAFGSFSTAAHRLPPPCWRPYSDNSPFNRLIPPHPRVSRQSRATIRYMSAEHWSFSGDGNRFELVANGTRPVYWATASDPLVTVHCRGGYSCQRNMRLHVPVGAIPSAGSDSAMVVVDQSKDREYDFWQATVPRNGEMWISGGNSIPIGPNKGSGMHGQASASYLGLLGGMLRVSELRAGVINHALVMVVPCVQWHDVWPSPRRGHGDAVCPGGNIGPHLGTLLQLKMSDRRIDRSHAPRWQKTIMHAMHDYGVYVVDTDGAAGRSIGWMALDTEHDVAGTGATDASADPMAHFVRSVGGHTVALGSRLGPSAFRVLAPCVKRVRCR